MNEMKLKHISSLRIFEEKGQLEMQKAIHILSSSSSAFKLPRFKCNNNINGGAAISFISFSSSSSITSTTRSITTSSLLLRPCGLKRRRRFRPFRAFVTRSESNPDASSPPSTSVAFQSTGITRKINFCQWCGGSTKHEIPDGEEKTRAICTLCGKIAYENPKMVVGCLIEHENKVLLCKRNIQPSHGRWTLPAGYMEMGESATEGAVRETFEEAGAEVQVLSPFAHLDIPRIGQTYIIFLAKLKTPHFSPGPESSECRLFALDDIPFDSLAFSSMVVTLNLYIEDLKIGRPKFHYGIINKRPGTSPSAIQAYTLDGHIQS